MVSLGSRNSAKGSFSVVGLMEVAMVCSVLGFNGLKEMIFVCSVCFVLCFGSNENLLIIAAINFCSVFFYVQTFATFFVL